MSKLSSSIPKWFSIDKYEFLTDISHFDLLGNLEFRARTLPSIDHEKPLYYTDAEGKKVPTEEVIEVVKERIQNPNIELAWSASDKFDNPETLPIENDNHIKTHPWPNYVRTKLASEISLEDFVSITKSNEWSIASQTWKKGSVRHNQYYQTSVNQAFSHDLPRGIIWVEINTAAKNSEILAEFEVFLNEYRRKHNHTPSIETESIEIIVKKIISYRVVPYIDLVTWGKLNHIKFKQSALVRALYPDMHEIGEYELRTKVSKYANIALSSELHNSLGRFEIEE